MSGAQIGGVVGGIIGFYFGNPQLGYAIGSAIGGAVDPTKVYGPRLTDASQQTSRDGVIRPFGYGTFPCSGNIMWQGARVERKHKDDGKGSGTEQVTYTYHRSYAIRVCEGPANILQIKRAGKLVYDARTDTDLVAELEAGGHPMSEVLRRIAVIRAQNSKFINRCTIYTGDETQLPDPTIEAKEGVGNVSPFRGTCYIVVEDDDLTQSAGAIPPFEFVVSVGGTVDYATPTIGTQTHQITLPAAAPALPETDSTSYVMANTGGADLWAHYVPNHNTNAGAVAYTAGVYNDALLPGALLNVTNAGDSPGDTRVKVLASSPLGWAISSDGNFGYCELLQGGVFKADLRPTSGTSSGWWYDEPGNYPEYGGLIWFGTSHVYIGVRMTGGVAYRKIFKWPLAENTGVTPATAASPQVTTGTHFFMHMDRGGGVWAIAEDESELVEYDANLVETSRVALPMSLLSIRAFGIDGGMLFLLFGDSMEVYSLTTFELVQTITVSGDMAGVNHRLVFTNDSLFVQSGSHIKRIEYVATCIPSIPEGWVELPDAPGSVMSPLGEIRQLCGSVVESIAVDKPTLASIVADLCQRRGLTADEYDVSQLTDLVPGFRVASETDVTAVLGPLAQAYQFDVGEWDGKLRFVKRGGVPVMALTMDDLAERDGDAIEQTRKQEAELLRKVTVAYMDPDAGYTATTQAWERRTSLIQAKGEQSVEVAVVMEADTAATVAKRKGLAGWAETERFKFSLPYKLTAITPTDVILLTDQDSTEHRVRLGDHQEDSGVLYIEGDRDGGTIYNAAAMGTRPPPRSVPEPSVIGPTTLHVMDLPVWDKDANDELGVYVAARGVLGGWTGASLQLSTDIGATWVTAAAVTVPSNIGYTTSALPAWDSAEYPSMQEVTVYLPEAPATVTYEALLNNRNRAALRNDSGAWEILQYETVTDNGAGSYTLSGLVRGRYATTPGLASAGAAFVLLDETVQFVRAERAYLNTAITVRGVSLGTVPENNVSSSLTITGQSQAEWPPHDVTATRASGTNDVTVTWVERRRLGTDIAPFNSKYHTGFRVTYSDGQTYDVPGGVFTHTRSAAPASQTISVQALNSITGAGQSSEAVTV